MKNKNINDGEFYKYAGYFIGQDDMFNQEVKVLKVLTSNKSTEILLEAQALSYNLLSKIEITFSIADFISSLLIELFLSRYFFNNMSLFERE